ncbi:BLUF domain-containing protein [Polaribacter sp. IC073]|uniref:BLUF domain-containing protein n=1 Tax=Polaribacter sp. IC073 TaxID=2508540 RepID=UPI0011BE29F8|nr:BLUF domain-containing protein [Polaribacter sp. IC073]TXD46497.1 BLUF domain-containing protein [Polaribacter sp. IC073]
MKLRRIAYTSKATIHFSKRTLLDLLHDSRAYNSLDNISGVLIHKDGYFLQIIEGELDDVNDLLARLVKDSRHIDFKIIDDRISDSRMFSDWAMGCADFDNSSLAMIPGIRTDLTDPKVIDSIIKRLPEFANILKGSLTNLQIYGFDKE